MSRFDDVNKICDAYIRLKKSYPPLKIYSSIIVGFPTETEDDLQNTLKFIFKVGFNGGRFFPYSCIPGTKAADIVPKITKRVIFKRIKQSKKYLKQSGYFVIQRGFSLVFYK
jgi:tRNA A37 methylthiotransferase MiaB